MPQWSRPSIGRMTSTAVLAWPCLFMTAGFLSGALNEKVLLSWENEDC